MSETQLPGNDFSRAWEYSKNADALLASRFNYGMVTQSMLLVSFVTMFATPMRAYTITVLVEVVIAMFGALHCIVQYLVSRSLVSKLAAMNDDYLKKDEVYKRYLAAKPGRPSGLQSRLVPWSLAVVWLILAIAAIAASARFGGVVVRP